MSNYLKKETKEQNRVSRSLVKRNTKLDNTAAVLRVTLLKFAFLERVTFALNTDTY